MQHTIQQHYNQQHYNQYIEKQHYNQQHNDNGAYEGVSETNSGATENNRTLIVGPSLCGKTHLLLNKLQLIPLDDPVREIRNLTITRSPEQYEGSRDVSMEENAEDLEMYCGCCVVFDNMLDSNQKLIDSFFTRGRHKLCDISYLSQSSMYQKTTRNNSNIKIPFQQTLKDVQHIYRDIAGVDMSYDEFKELCRVAWKKTELLKIKQARR